MGTRERLRDRATARAVRIRQVTGTEIRTARLTAGLSLRDAAESVGLDYGRLARIERGEVERVRLDQLCLACAAVGLVFAGRPYPAGDPVRDAAHLKLLERLRAALPSTLPWRTEVALPISGDHRALDALTIVEGRRVGFEGETRLHDVQAVGRKAALKKRDAELERIFLVVSDTRANRAVIREHGPALRASFPLDTRQALRALRRGELPAGDGIIVI